MKILLNYFIILVGFLTHTVYSSNLYDDMNYDKIKDIFIKSCKEKDECKKLYKEELNFNNECARAIFNECPLIHIPIENSNYFNGYCRQYFNSPRDKCIKLYTNGYESLPACKNENTQYLKLLKYSYSGIYKQMRLLCAHDNSGNLCPFYHYNVNNTDKSISKFMAYVKNSCPSKRCSEVYFNALSLEKDDLSIDIIDVRKNGNSYREALKYLKSYECALQIKDTIQNNDSDKKFISIITVALGLLIITLY